MLSSSQRLVVAAGQLNRIICRSMALKKKMSKTQLRKQITNLIDSYALKSSHNKVISVQPIVDRPAAGPINRFTRNKAKVMVAAANDPAWGLANLRYPMQCKVASKVTSFPAKSVFHLHNSYVIPSSVTKDYPLSFKTMFLKMALIHAPPAEKKEEPVVAADKKEEAPAAAK